MLWIFPSKKIKTYLDPPIPLSSMFFLLVVVVVAHTHQNYVKGLSAFTVSHCLLPPFLNPTTARLSSSSLPWNCSDQVNKTIWFQIPLLTWPGSSNHSPSGGTVLSWLRGYHPLLIFLLSLCPFLLNLFCCFLWSFSVGIPSGSVLGRLILPPCTPYTIPSQDFKSIDALMAANFLSPTQTLNSRLISIHLSTWHLHKDV